LSLLLIANFLSTTHTAHSVAMNKAGGAFAVASAFITFFAGASRLLLPETIFVRILSGSVPSSKK
jgi:hypothetical protein